MTLALLIAAGSAFGKCPIERARYRMIHDSDITAGFSAVKSPTKWPSDLVFFVRSRSKNYGYWYVGQTGRDIYWFRFDATKKQYVYLTLLKARPSLRNPAPEDAEEESMGDIRFMAADADHRFEMKTPTRRTARPDYILLPDLAEMLWYSVNRREGVPTDFFKFTHCAPPSGQDF